MKKLTLEHLAGYLPYKLQCITDKASYSNPIKGELTMIETDSEEQNICIVPEHGGYALCEINRTLKPILRPLSDLTKEIEVGGEKFVAIDRIKKLFVEIDGTDYGFKYLGYINHTHTFYLDGKHIGLMALPYFVVQWLYEHHFVINIPEELYININSI